MNNAILSSLVGHPFLGFSVSDIAVLKELEPARGWRALEETGQYSASMQIWIQQNAWSEPLQ